ncbi:polysaccharide deacetylase family protein [Actinocrispum sp. NPDC049592]|uniref:polysaccharide deacetylase family protein n=1 Tax=Actinocrispum sp. NPDC049592 TaxID=3154835 RepID=UPI00341C2A21
MRTKIAALLVSVGLLSACGAVQTTGVPVGPATVTVTVPPPPQDDATPVRSSPTTTPKTAPATHAEVIGHTTPAPGKHIALSFDDGPDPTWTPQVLDLLAQYHVKATFCLVGRNAKAYPALVRKIVAGGHALCDHSMTHDEHLPNRDASVRHKEIEGGLQAILAAAPDASVPYFRAPAGAFGKAAEPDSVQRIAASLGMQCLAWSIDTLDWTKPGTDAILTAIKRAGDHDVVLLHDAGGDRSQTVAALRSALPWLAAQGYQFDLPA